MASLIRMVSTPLLSDLSGSLMVPMPVSGTGLPPIPLTRPDCGTKEVNNDGLLTMNRFAPES
jgi:hypothetical protein